MKKIMILTAQLLILPVAACGGDDKTPAQMCEEIGELCHDTATALGQQCHELGHAENPAACEAQYDDCIAECSGSH
jgi:hypothetical protein